MLLYNDFCESFVLFILWFFGVLTIERDFLFWNLLLSFLLLLKFLLLILRLILFLLLLFLSLDIIFFISLFCNNDWFLFIFIFVNSFFASFFGLLDNVSRLITFLILLGTFWLNLSFEPFFDLCSLFLELFLFFESLSLFFCLVYIVIFFLISFVLFFFFLSRVY